MTQNLGDDAEFMAAFSETINNGQCIDWRYWVEKMPVWTAGQAVRLLCGLDPDVFESYESRPNANDRGRAIATAKSIERLAKAQRLEPLSPSAWVSWATDNGFVAHIGLHLALEESKGGDQVSKMVATQAETKRAQGRYTLQEAAEKISAESGAPATHVLVRLKDAATSGALPMYAPGATVQYVYGPGAGLVVREFYEEAYWDDLNAWLDAHERRADTRFEDPVQRKTSKTHVATSLPVSRQRWQEHEILRAINEMGHVPTKLLVTPRGTAGVKAEVRAKLTGNKWQGTVFDKAWERLRATGEIADAPSKA